MTKSNCEGNSFENCNMITLSSASTSHTVKVRKTTIVKPRLSATPESGRRLVVNVVATNTGVRALITQSRINEPEIALGQFNRAFKSTELHDPPLEKHCAAVVFALNKLRYYASSNGILLVSRVDPAKYFMTRPNLNAKLKGWIKVFSEFNVLHRMPINHHGELGTEFWGRYAPPCTSNLHCQFPHTPEVTSSTWEMYFDGSPAIRPIPVKVNLKLTFVAPEGGVIRHVLALTEPRLNEEAEYEALVAGLEIARWSGIKELNIHGNSMRLLNQMEGIVQPTGEIGLRYRNRVRDLKVQFEEINFIWISRASAKMERALAWIKNQLSPEDKPIYLSKPLIYERDIHPCILEPGETSDAPAAENVPQLLITIEDDWYEAIHRYYLCGDDMLFNQESQWRQIRERALKLVRFNQTLYKRMGEGVWARCVLNDEALEIMEEIHEGLCGAHESGPKMYLRIKRMGYYWPTMVADCLRVAKTCRMCQLHSPYIHQAPNPLHPTIASWPFDAWGTDIVGPIEPPASNGDRFILAFTDYFSKWAEARSFKEIKATTVVKFVKDHILYRFGTPRRVTSDNGAAFKNALIDKLASKFNIDWRYSTIYNPRANGLAEAFNKTLVSILKKTVGENHRSWHERLPEALWAYRITCRTPTQATPYSLVYGVEAVLPLEIEIPSLRVALQQGITNDEKIRLRLDELDALDEKRLHAHQSLELYQARMERAYNKMARIRQFKKGELVLIPPQQLGKKTPGKFKPKWDGPYVIEKVFEGGAYQLIDQDGQRVSTPLNGRYLKKYYA